MASFNSPFTGNIFQDAIEAGRTKPAPVSTIEPDAPVPFVSRQAKIEATPPSPVIQGFLDASSSDPALSSNRDAVIQMIQNNEDKSFIEDAITNQIGWTPPKPTMQENAISSVKESASNLFGTLGGAVEKAGESFMG